MKISKELHRYYQKALRHGDVDSALVVCIATVNNKPVSMTTNRRGGGKVSKWTRHAEERMSERLPYYTYFHDVIVTVIRFRKDGSVGMAKPCGRCERLLRKASIKHVYYSGLYGEIEKLY